MKQRIDDHQRVQDLRWQIHELMDFCLTNWHTVEKVRNMIALLLQEHEEWSTDEFWKHKVYTNSQRDDRLNPQHFIWLV